MYGVRKAPVPTSISIAPAPAFYNLKLAKKPDQIRDSRLMDQSIANAEENGYTPNQVYSALQQLPGGKLASLQQQLGISPQIPEEFEEGMLRCESAQQRRQDPPRGNGESLGDILIGLGIGLIIGMGILYYIYNFSNSVPIKDVGNAALQAAQQSQ